MGRGNGEVTTAPGVQRVFTSEMDIQLKKKITIETLIEEGKYIRCWHRASIYIKELILGISH